MGKSQVMWILRTQEGDVKGPFETHVILKMIKEGQIDAQLMISKYPDGKWTYISKEPEFYDSMLDAIENALKVNSKKREPQTPKQEETIFMPPPPAAESVLKNQLILKEDASKPVPDLQDINEPSEPIFQQATRAEYPRPAPYQQPPVIDLASLEEIKKKNQKKRLTPVLMLIAATVLMFYIFYDPTGVSRSSDNKISLILPGEAKQPLSEEEIRKKYGAATELLLKDTFESYMEAQKILVHLIERIPSQHIFELPARGALCLAYKELWPFSQQDAQDLKTVTTFTQSTRAKNVISGFGNFCEAVKLLVSGRYREGRGAVDALLETNEDETFTMAPILILIKGELLENDKEFQFATAYYEKAAQDIPAWVRPKIKLGLLMYNTRDYKNSSEWFRSVLQSNPDHKVARIGLALNEYYGFRQYDSSYSLLNEALKSKSRIPRALESEAYQVFAELNIDRNNKEVALAAAQKSYELNANNDIARQLILRLGGSAALLKNERSQHAEMMFLGDQYVRQGDCLAAQAEFKAAYELDKTNAIAAMKAGKCLWQLNQSFEAVEWLNRAIKSDPQLISALVLKADYLSQRFDFAGAAQSITAASRISPNNHEVLRGMALLDYRKGNMTGAINFALRAMKIYDADLETHIILANANIGLARSIRATQKQDIELRENALRDAVRYADRAVEMDSTSSEAHIAYAEMRALTEGTNNAVSYLQEIIRKYPYTSEYRIALGDIYRKSERWRDSRLIYQSVVETEPRNKAAWLGLGESLRALGEIESSLKAFLNAAVIDPVDGEALFQAGRLYYETGRYEEALQQFLRVKNMNPHFPRTNFYAGKSAFALGRFKEALQHGREEKRLNPNLADSYILIAEVHDVQGAFGECAAEYSGAIKLRPNSAEIYVQAAKCYRQAGSLDIAETMLSLAKDRESGYAPIYRELGALFERKGEQRAARQAYLNYLELAPNAPDKREVEARLSRLGGR